jgi:hypothetical protein
MGVIGTSLLDTLIIVSIAIVVACFVAALGGFVRYATRLPGNTTAVYWLMKLGMFVGVPFGIVGMISGYLTGSSRVSAISAIVPAALTLVGGVAVYLFTKGGKSAVMAAFAVVNFSVMILIGVSIGARHRVQAEDYEKSYDYRVRDLETEFRLQQYRHGLGLDTAPKTKKEQDD